MARKKLNETTYARDGKLLLVDFTPLPLPKQKPEPTKVDDTTEKPLGAALRGLIEGLFIGINDQGSIYEIMRDASLSRADEIADAIEAKIGPVKILYSQGNSFITAKVKKERQKISEAKKAF